jgi:cell division initiation protein
MSTNNDEQVTASDPATTPQGRRLPGVERQRGPSPLDMRQARFATTMRGFDRTEVATFLQDAAESYEQSLRDNDRLRQEITRLEAQLQQFRELEGGLRTMLLSAQKVADDMRENAQQEAARIVREAEGRAELLAQTAQAQAEDLQRDIDGLKLKRRESETALESMISSLQSTIEFMREQDSRERDLKLVAPRTRIGTASA